jgi:hypothetical protein
LFDLRERWFRVCIRGVERLGSKGTQFWEMSDQVPIAFLLFYIIHSIDDMCRHEKHWHQTHRCRCKQQCIVAALPLVERLESLRLVAAAPIHVGMSTTIDNNNRRQQQPLNNAIYDYRSEWLEFELSLCNLPRGARLCFTLMADCGGQMVPLGWVTSSLLIEIINSLN